MYKFTTCSFWVLFLMISLSLPVYSESSNTFAINYDLRLDANNSHMQQKYSGVKVSAGERIPYLEFENYKVDLRFSESNDNQVVVEAVIYEKLNGNWTPIGIDIPKHTGKAGEPLNLLWKKDGYVLDVALIVEIVKS